MIRMRLTVILVVALVWIGPVWGRDDGGPKYNAPAEIVATLPKICWWFYVDNIPSTAEYNIRVTCGTYSNHYCPGLVAIKLAEKAKTKQQRSEALITAKNEMLYTLRLVKSEVNPECSVLPTARMNLDFVNLQLELMNGKTIRR